MQRPAPSSDAPTARPTAPLYAEVALPLRLAQTFTYSLPLALREETRVGARLLVPLGRQLLTGYVVALHEEETIHKSFRNLERVAVIAPGELEVAAVVWARSLVISEAALPIVQGRAS